MAAPRRESDEERRRLFRRMEWVFVYAPPLLAAFIAAFGAAFLAFFIPVPGTGFWGRWAAAVGLILGVPLIAYVVREWWRKR
jgi:membrane associated rhomboid family serine protease